MIRRTMFIGAVAPVVAALAASLSQATAPGANGQIAFQRYELHDAPYAARILVANSDGSGQRVITHPPPGYVDDHPDWAADGSRIVFDRGGGAASDSTRHIWTVAPDGRNPRRLGPRCPAGAPPPRCPDDHFPAYSPDGRHIAFTRYQGAGAEFVMVADANLRHARQIARGSEPDWSPDGKRLVFVAKPRAFQAVYVSNANGAGVRRITPWRLRAGYHPDWSPDGTRILFASGPPDRANLFTIRLDGTGLRKLTHFKGLTKVDGGSYSPDGESIAFHTVVGAVNPPGATLADVFVMTADGTDIRPVTRARNWDGSPDWGPRR